MWVATHEGGSWAPPPPPPPRTWSGRRRIWRIHAPSQPRWWRLLPAAAFIRGGVDPTRAHGSRGARGPPPAEWIWWRGAPPAAQPSSSSSNSSQIQATAASQEWLQAFFLFLLFFYLIFAGGHLTRLGKERLMETFWLRRA